MEGILLRSESLASQSLDDDDDARSVVTVVPGGTSDAEPHDDEPESSGEGRDVDGFEKVSKSELSNRIHTLETEMAETVLLSKALQTQHSEAMTTVKSLTDRLGQLESGIEERVTTAVEQAEARWEAWRSKFEERWKQEREAWESERDRLRGIVREWEEASRRAAEEAEERAMNEQLSDDDLADEEEPAEHEVDEAELATMDDSWTSDGMLPSKQIDGSSRSVPKSRRRRLSTKTTLAVRGLRSVAHATGASTPKGTDRSEGVVTQDASDAALNKIKRPSNWDKLARGSTYSEKDSSESGRESADTLKDEKVHETDADGAVQRSLPPVSFQTWVGHLRAQQSIPIATVIVVAAVAGLIYYRHRD